MWPDSSMLRLSVCVLFLPVCWCVPLAGWVESPGYPRGYEPHAALSWSRCAPPGHTLTLTLVHLDLEDGYECENDVLKVYADGGLISSLCGRMSLDELRSSVNPSLLSSSGGCLNVSFSADYSNTERHTGFRAFYTTQDYDECDDPNIECSHFCYNYIGGYMCTCPPGYLLNADNHTCSVSCTEDLSGSLRGQVTPPGHPGPLRLRRPHCSYSLAVEEGLQLVLEFTGQFDVETKPSGECADAVRPIDTGSSQVHILFDSDDAGTNMGFTVTYKTKRMTCPGEVTAESSLMPRRQQYVMGDTVTVTCDAGTAVELAVAPGIKSNMTFESRCQKNGEWKPVYQCEAVDCGEPDIPHAVEIVRPLSTHYKSELRFTCISKYYKLESDEVFTCEADGHWKSITGQTKMPRCLPVCGVTESQMSSGRILGGKRAKLGEIPWQLLIKNPSRGGASLISDQWAVTAAHVVDGLETTQLAVRGGMIDGAATDAVIMYTEKIIIHPKYEKGKSDESRTTFDHDIALLKMKNKVQLGPNLIPICLPEWAAAKEGEMSTVSGYGMREKKDIARFLFYADIAEIGEDKCKETPNNKNGNRLVFTENMFCAGMEGMDSCQGDSGGPLFVPRVGTGTADKPYRLKGIVSWGAFCRDRNYKGYYTKVQNYLDWIRETMEKDEED
ncbi:LOW QUALITY PROTEIN: mannan-binding lectin serine protease 2 [Sardina pilchardus]|uniref:LOW QUALITY PROTEIN: mannan-binding lectin serine protease 2 n=1 Tax=Sardina pilchardus TaxID=27697 RepID=UPI002E106E4D